MARIILKGSELRIAAGVAASTNVGNATLVRVMNPTATAAVIHVQDPAALNEYSGIGTYTIAGSAVDFVEKQPTYTIHSESAVYVTKVGFSGI